MAESTKTFNASLSSTLLRNYRNNQKNKGREKLKAYTNTGNQERSISTQQTILSSFCCTWCMWEHMKEFHDR